MTRKPTDTRVHLLETAINLIRHSNYSCVGVNEICASAGVTKGGFYHYFESKADLFYEAAHYHWQGIKQQLDAIYSPSVTAAEHLESLLQFIVERQLEGGECSIKPICGCPFFAAGAQAGSAEDKVRQASLEMMEMAIRYNIVLIRNLQAEQVIPPTASPEVLSPLLYQLVQGIMLAGRVHQDVERLKQDLRAGFYELLAVKQEFRRVWVEDIASAAAAKAKREVLLDEALHSASGI